MGVIMVVRTMLLLSHVTLSSQENCTCLDNASILFINTSLLLEHRKDWRFLYSTQTHPRSLEVSSTTNIINYE